MNHPLQVGITGGIGAGKSLVCHIFRCLGAPVYDADSQAKNLMITDEILLGQIKKEFGLSAYLPDGSLDRTYLSSAVFAHPDRLEKLNSIVHPRVAEDYKGWLATHRHEKYVIREAALFYEIGISRSVDKMIVVSAPEDIRIKRVIARDVHRTKKDIQAIIKNQLPDEEKAKRADYIIYNDDQHMIIPQVLQLHTGFISVGQSFKATVS